MCQFAAVMKDSYREAVSTWVVPVMLGFAGLLTLLAASVSFQPVSPSESVERSLGILNWAFRFDPNLKGTGFAVENVSATNPAEPWNGETQFDLVFRATKPQILKQMMEDVNFPLTKRRVENYVRKDYPQFRDVIVEDRSPIPPPAPPLPDGKPGEPARTEVRFHVTARGATTTDPLAWPHVATVLFVIETGMPTTLRQGVYHLEKWLVNDVGAWVLLVVGVVVTAGFVPNLLRKGALDLIVTKPIGPRKLLAFKYLGGLVFVALLASVAVVGVWLAVGLRSGVWNPNFLLLIPVLTFYFAVLYAVSVLAAALTRSPLVAILATMLAWVVFVAAGWGNAQLTAYDDARQQIEEQMAQAQKDAGTADVPKADGSKAPFQPPAVVRYGVRGLYTVSPRVYDLDTRMSRFIAEGVLTSVELKADGLDKPLPPWWQTVGVSLAFIAVVVTLACRIVARRDG